MTDARETVYRAVAIARGDAPECQNWSQLSPKNRDIAELGLRRVLDSGFRILGPDEVDPVTVEKVLVAVNEVAARGFSAAYRCGATDCDAAIRALTQEGK